MMSVPEKIVHQQLEAYNAHDIPAYVATTFSPDIQLYELSGQQPVLTGEMDL